MSHISGCLTYLSCVQPQSGGVVQKLAPEVANAVLKDVVRKIVSFVKIVGTMIAVKSVIASSIANRMLSMF